MEIRKKAQNERGGGEGLSVKGWISEGRGLMNPTNTPVHTHIFKSLITCLICCNDSTCNEEPNHMVGMC